MTTEPSVLLFFIDGLGIGTRGPHNPLDNLDAVPLAVFHNEEPQPFLDGFVVPTDARLGIEGRPQSASGQTTILTGVNAPAAVSYHKQGFPNKALLEIINNHSIFKQLSQSGVKPITFANAYTSRFFDERPRWVSATTAAVEAAGMKFRTIEDLRNDAAIFMDYTNRILIERGEDVNERTEREAAVVLAKLGSQHRFTLYEYFITDKAGHSQDMALAQKVLESLALFIRELLNLVDLERTTVILTSDHGNIEDLSSRNHTLHAVPTVVWGTQRERIADQIKTLADITPSIVALLTETQAPNEPSHN